MERQTRYGPLIHADFDDSKTGVKALEDVERTQPTLSSPAEFLADLHFATGDFPAYIQDTQLSGPHKIPHSHTTVRVASSLGY